jgi:hypothetical protein
MGFLQALGSLATSIAILLYRELSQLERIFRELARARLQHRFSAF